VGSHARVPRHWHPCSHPCSRAPSSPRRCFAASGARAAARARYHPLPAASFSVPSAAGHLTTASPDLIPASSCPLPARRLLSTKPVGPLTLAPARTHPVALSPAPRSVVPLLQTPCSARHLLIGGRRLVLGKLSLSPRAPPLGSPSRQNPLASLSVWVGTHEAGIVSAGPPRDDRRRASQVLLNRVHGT
jgi:hypothetical protein